jgi:hypothetical protein
MIDKDENPAAWALLLDELDDAREHLENLVNEMSTSDDFSEVEFRIALGHIYAHLNREWHGRGDCGEAALEKHDEYSELPTDLPML